MSPARHVPCLRGVVLRDVSMTQSYKYILAKCTTCTDIIP